MTFHEFGTENQKIIILIHPSLVMWDYYEYLIPLLESKYHIIVPALPGYDEGMTESFTSIEQIAEEMEDWLIQQSFSNIECVYGCSMGGAVVIRMLADNRITIQNAVIDGGITPYQLPRVITRIIALRDFLMVSMGKIGGLKLLEKVFQQMNILKMI